MCPVCNKNMLLVNECLGNKLIKFPDGELLPASVEHFDEPSGRCHDCNAVHGKMHHTGCDAERCPRCGGQLILCYCFEEGTF